MRRARFAIEELVAWVIAAGILALLNGLRFLYRVACGGSAWGIDRGRLVQRRWLRGLTWVLLAFWVLTSLLGYVLLLVAHTSMALDRPLVVLSVVGAATGLAGAVIRALFFPRWVAHQPESGVIENAWKN